MTDMHFEDFEPGQRFTSRAIPMTRERIISFAEEFDPQPQHMDEAAAAQTQFGELIASGWHTAATTMRLQYEAAFNRIAGAAMGAGVEKLTWVRPVRPGDVIHALVEVSDKRLSRSRPDRGLITFLTTTLNQNEQPVLTMVGTVIVPRREQI